MMKRLLVLAGIASLAALSCLAVAEIGPVAPEITVVPESAVQRIYGPYAPYVWAIFNTLVHTVIVCLVAFPFQALFPAVRRRPKVLSYEYWLDLLYWFQGLFLTALQFFVAVSWLVEAVYGRSGAYFPALAQLPYWLQVAISILAFDFMVYWRHRLEHTFSVLWSYHAVHHTAEQIDVLTTFRVHPFELVAGALTNTAIIRLGLDPGATTFGFALYLYYNNFIHTNVRIRFPGFLKYVLVSPFMHQWHHAKINQKGSNYGVVFAWNDWLFRTAYHPEHYPTEFGLDVPPNERVGHSYLRHLVYPLQYFYARVMAWRAARAVTP